MPSDLIKLPTTDNEEDTQKLLISIGSFCVSAGGSQRDKIALVRRAGLLFKFISSESRSPAMLDAKIASNIAGLLAFVVITHIFKCILTTDRNQLRMKL